MWDRPYSQYSYYKLREIADTNKGNRGIYEELEYELSFRNTDFANSLSVDVKKHLKMIDAQERALEYLQARKLFTKEETEKEFEVDFKRFHGKLIGVTGTGPHEEKWLRSLIFWCGGVNSRDFCMWGNNQIIVLGYDGFDEEYLRQTIEFIQEKDIIVHFLSQEDFLKFVYRNELVHYYPNDPSVKSHDGLSFLASIGFQWPSTYATREFDKTGGDFYGRTQHPLAEIYKYNVKKDTSISDRHTALKRAIRPWPNGLGLREVVDHIAYLVRDRKRHQPERLKGSIGRWEDDLEWLRENYYKNSIYSFIWPSY
jgi:hypothetical protein